MPARVALFLADELNFELQEITDMLEAMRIVKSADEVAQIRQTVGLCDAGFEAAQEAIVPGLSELEVALEVWKGMSLAAGEPLPSTGDFVSGLRTAEVGGEPSQRLLEPGDLFIIDLFPPYRGYYADQTRTFVVGSPMSWHEEVQTVLEEAFEAGRSCVRPGVRCSELDAAIRRVITAAGYGQAMRHEVSHGIGLTLHEQPFVEPGNETLLEEGMVITIEPGIYLPGKGGLRLEDDVLVTAQGCEPLGGFPRRIIACG
jgi:Xaa-Pro aminopeptidase